MATADHFTNGLTDGSGAKAFDLRLSCLRDGSVYPKNQLAACSISNHPSPLHSHSLRPLLVGCRTLRGW